MSKSHTICIDGGPGSGKSTVGMMLARLLGYRFFSAGDHFRTFALAALRYGVIQDGEVDMTRCLELLGNVGITTDGRGSFYLNGLLFKQTELHSKEATAAVHLVAAVQEVRDWHNRCMRDYAAGHDGCVVFEGRLTWEVFSEAMHFAFRVRDEVAHQRTTSGKGADVAEVNHDRHRHDLTRKVAPVKEAPDAHVIDTSDRTPDSVVEEIDRVRKEWLVAV